MCKQFRLPLAVDLYLIAAPFYVALDIDLWALNQYHKVLKPHELGHTPFPHSEPNPTVAQPNATLLFVAGFCPVGIEQVKSRNPGFFIIADRKVYVAA